MSFDFGDQNRKKMLFYFGEQKHGKQRAKCGWRHGRRREASQVAFFLFFGFVCFFKMRVATWAPKRTSQVNNVCLRVCVIVCVCVCVCIHIYILIYTYVYTYIHVLYMMYIYIYV